MGVDIHNPLIPGFNPDPSAVYVDGVYWLVTSSFEYLPGLPVYRSTDFETWELVGHVATRPGQVEVGEVPTNAGVWAPTIRHRNGVFYVIVTVALSPRRCVVFTTDDPAGSWSDGVTIEGVQGIDPDLVWDDEGTAYVTYSGIVLDEHGHLVHQGIQQVRVDLVAGRALEVPRSLWSGTGLKFPEAPHLVRRGVWWYLLIAEGGTERGHAVSVARSSSPSGPFHGHPANPILSASGTSRAVQNTGHADLVAAPHGDVLVLLGMRPLGSTQAFSPLGRETFWTRVTWVDDWPYAEAVVLNTRAGTESEEFDLTVPEPLKAPGWLAVRTTPELTATPSPEGLVLLGSGGPEDLHVRFVGRRQRHTTSTFTTTVDASNGVGGLLLRYDERQWLALEVEAATVRAVASLAGFTRSWSTAVETGPVELRIETQLPAFAVSAFGADTVRLWAGPHLLTELDGRYWTAETCTSFTGRVTGMYARTGRVVFRRFGYRGSDVGFPGWDGGSPQG